MVLNESERSLRPNSLVAVTVIVAIALAVVGCSKSDHSVGKDTAATFCDGRFQVLRNGSPIAFYSLVDEESIAGIDNKITGWSDNGDWAYFANYDRELILLDCKSATVHRFHDISVVPDIHRQPFLDLLKRVTNNRSPATKVS